MSLSKKTTDSDIVREDKAGINLGNIFTVDANLRLPFGGKAGSVITWESRNPGVMDRTGKITRPEPGAGNRTVTLVATITCGTARDTREFKITVLEKEKPKYITEIRPVQIETVAGNPPLLPMAVITGRDDGSYGTAIVTWDDIDASVYAQAGTFLVEGTVNGTGIRAIANVKVRSADDRVATMSGRSVLSGCSVPSRVAGPFDLHQVTLQESVFTENRDRDYEYLLSRDEDQMLYNFREAAGLDTGKGSPMDGWDAPNCNLRGHTTGHYLSALALAYASSGDDRFKKKIGYIVRELGVCQDAMAASGQFGPGFLSGYSEEQFIKLEQYAKYPEIWAPYYTLHKIMAGLLDCYELAGNVRALEITEKLGDWVYTRLSRLSRGQLAQMWAMYIAGEYGSINETLARLYAITGRQSYFTAAKYFDNDSLFIPMARNVDTLADMHANQHIPGIIGALEVFSVSGEPYYYDVAANFWEMVVGRRIYNIGGTGSGEMFKQADKIARYINDKTAETCATYNMLKLSRGLFFYSPETKYMDYCERALYNHIVASQDQSGPSGGSTYFMPLYPGTQKEYDSDGNSCCHGTGMENHTKYQDSIYFQSEDRTALYVNLYIASELNWKSRGFRIVQTGNFLVDQASTLTVYGSGRLDIKLRIPFWAEKGFTVAVNGARQDIAAAPGSYTTLSREWNSGDEINISIPFPFRLERTPDDPSIAGILYGPLVLVGKSASQEYIELALEESDLSRSIAPAGEPLTFTTNGITLVPNYMAYDIPYHAYFKVGGPEKASAAADGDGA
jgi:DUF1680 family protein